MTTIKACTDLEQSEKLSEILPLESADMCYDGYALDNDGNHPVRLHKPDGEYDIPCWSLAALLAILPKGTNISTPNPIDTLSYSCWNHYDEIYASNPVDACVELILKFNELKML